MATKIRTVAIPQDHGSWVFLISPLVIGFFAASEHAPSQIIIVIAGLAGFLLKQPVSIWVKIRSGRRADTNLPIIKRITTFYLFIALFCAISLSIIGQVFILLLAIPGGLIFIWHLYLVSLRKERYQMGVDIIASGTLALAAPAIYWSGMGEPGWEGLLLWMLCWLQSASSIVYIFLRLKQREWKESPTLVDRLQAGLRAMLYAGFNVLLAVGLALIKLSPVLLFIPYLLQFTETLYGSMKPAISVKPTVLGIRQLIISTLFTILFILIWVAG